MAGAGASDNLPTPATARYILSQKMDDTPTPMPAALALQKLPPLTPVVLNNAHKQLINYFYQPLVADETRRMKQKGYSQRHLDKLKRTGKYGEMSKKKYKMRWPTPRY
jgi:hypothetical protein